MKLPVESGWSHETPPTDAVKVVIRSQDHTKVILVYVLPMDKTLTEATFIERFKNRWFAHGTGKGKTDERITLEGRPAYRIKDIANLGGKEVYRAATLVINSGRFYQIDAMGVGTDPMKDPGVTECVGSFHFLGLDDLPPASTARYDPAGKLPEIIADLTVVALVGVVVVFVLAKIIRSQANKPAKAFVTVNASTPPRLPKAQTPPLPIPQPPVLPGRQSPPFTI
jgi:hypothetical protein